MLMSLSRVESPHWRLLQSPPLFIVQDIGCSIHVPNFWVQRPNAPAASLRISHHVDPRNAPLEALEVLSDQDSNGGRNRVKVLQESDDDE